MWTPGNMKDKSGCLSLVSHVCRVRAVLLVVLRSRKGLENKSTHAKSAQLKVLRSDMSASAVHRTHLNLK